MYFGYRTTLLVLPALFLLSALIGAWISFVPSAAWPRFGLVMVGVITYYILALIPEHIEFGSWRRISLLQGALATMPTVIIVYFVLTNDWVFRLGKLPLLDPILYGLASLNIKLPGLYIDSNVFGAVIVTLLPLQFSSISAGGRGLKRQHILLLFISALGIVLSESRGAWLALFMVVVVWIIWKISGPFANRWTIGRKRQAQIAITLSIVFSTVLVWTVIFQSPFGHDLIESRLDRLEIWRNSLSLARDYPFTGVGLGGFPMAYSAYVMLLHDGYTFHAHNLYLDLWLEQGLLGLFVFITWTGIAAFSAIESFLSNRTVLRMQMFALASLGIILLNGFWDDPLHGKVTPLLFVPLGLLARQERPAVIQPSGKATVHLMLILAVVATFSLSWAVLLPEGRAIFFANLATLNQTRAELSVYRWPDIPIQDQVRRLNKGDLAPAISQYRLALAIDAHNPTANRRLGQIEISLGQYEPAKKHLQAAYAALPSDRATRQLLGEIYACEGKPDEAVQLWRTIDVSHNELLVREWWYWFVGEMDRAASMQVALQLLAKFN